jgi:hypothetical protein
MFVVPNAGTVAAPSYTPGTAGKVSAALPAIGGAISMDGSGNIWASSVDFVSEVVPSGTGATLTLGAPANSAVSNLTTTTASEVDGGGTLWTPSLTSSGNIIEYLTTPGAIQPTNNDLRPCYNPPAAGIACSATVASAYPTTAQVDSAGAVWVSGQGSGATGFVVQLLGPGSPTWPQLSYAVPGTKPQ